MTHRSIPTFLLLIITAITAAVTGPAAASTTTDPFRGISHVIVPQRRAFPMGHIGHAVLIDAVRAEVEIRDRTARTTLEIDLRNPGARRIEAILLLPVPGESAVSNFMFEGSQLQPTARLLPADEARFQYDEIVRRVKDPALLEFAGYNLIRSSVFPIEAHGTQQIRLTYEHLLDGDGPRVDYVLPRSESLELTTNWSIRATVRSNSAIATVYSPSHEIQVTRMAPEHLTAQLRRPASPQPGAFRLSFLLQKEDVTASLYAYPDSSIGGGYFLLMAGLPARLSDRADRQSREVTIVIDRSGSMAGEKMDQVRAAALQIIEGLEDGEAFNIIDYATTVERFRPSPVVKSTDVMLDARAYLAQIRPTGGTNIHGALATALEQPHDSGRLPIVLFLTDGLPTVGETAEHVIADLVQNHNPHERRVFTFGVGNDVNVPLLDRVADLWGATATYALPGEDVELAVASVYKRLFGPVLAGVDLRTVDVHGVEVTSRVREMIPQRLPDLFEDDQLIVFGQYRASDDRLNFELTGDFLGTERRFRFSFDLDQASTGNAFVPRLWASRRIAYLVDQIRQLGAQSGSNSLIHDPSIVNDPRYRELTDEIVRLSTQFGILTEYTAFLATEGTNFARWDDVVAKCGLVLNERAVQTRSGQAAVNQGMNFNRQKMTKQVDYFNNYWNADLEQVEITTVQHVCDRSFFKRGSQWIDGRLVAGTDVSEPDRIVDFGSEAHLALVDRFVEEGRQGVLSLRGNILLRLDGETVLVRNQAPDAPVPTEQP